MSVIISNKFVTDILLNAISASSNILTGLLGNVFTKVIGNNEVIECLNELDIESTIRTIEIIIKDLKKRNCSESITLCLNQLTDIIVIIEKDLSNIYEMLKFNKTCYFPSWRSYDLTSNLKQLKVNDKILAKRFNLLSTVINMTDKLNLVNTSNDKEDIDKDLTKSTLLITKI